MRKAQSEKEIWGGLQIGQGQIMQWQIGLSESSNSQAKIVQRWLTKNRLQAKIDCKQSFAMRFSQRWIMSKVLQGCLVKGRL